MNWIKSRSLRIGLGVICLAILVANQAKVAVGYYGLGRVTLNPFLVRQTIIRKEVKIMNLNVQYYRRTYKSKRLRLLQNVSNGKRTYEPTITYVISYKVEYKEIPK